jgi:hypothetical protein
VPELVAIDRQDTELYLDFLATLLRVRFVGISKERARAATRILVEMTATMLDVSQELGEQSRLFLAEGLVALKCYLHTLERL